MKRDKIIYWIATGLLFLFEGVLTLFYFNTDASKAGMAHLGYPGYFGILLSIFKILGALALIIPQVPGRIKEWAYAGFFFDFFSAFVSMWAVDGLSGATFSPWIFIGILAVSYVYYHRLRQVSIKTVLR